MELKTEALKEHTESTNAKRYLRLSAFVIGGCGHLYDAIYKCTNLSKLNRGIAARGEKHA